MKRAEPLLVALVIALATLLRLVALHADPPAWLSWSAGLYSDEGIYSEDSRLLVLYGQHMQGNFRIAAIAPLHYWLLVWVFRHVATISLGTVRIVSILFSTATLFCFWAAMRLTYGARIAGTALALLAFSAFFLLYNRMGLLETPALFWLTAGFLSLACAEARPASDPSRSNQPGARFAVIWLIGAGALAGIAVAWKATFALGALSLIIAAAIRRKHLAVAALAGFLGVLTLDFFAFVQPNRTEVARADRYYLLHQYLPRTLPGVWRNLERAVVTGQGDGAFVYMLHFSPLLLILAVAATVSPRLRSKRDAWLWLWLGIPLCAMLVMNYSPSRYFVQFWPAFCGLAACALARMAQRRVAAIAFAAALCIDALMLGRSYHLRAYTVQRDAQTLERVLPRDSWIAGQFAPTICMECSLRSLYVQPGLANDSESALQLLPITHVLATRVSSPASNPWLNVRRQLIADPGGLRSLPVGRFKVDVYANLNALP